ncbi:MAG: hypothetical protein LBD51_02430 [Bifidobacteriaceae bacterium]|jgi:hypothetical protein|nr:hypothetical protein [Bifidobacteriaceae bacterium]
MLPNPAEMLARGAAGLVAVGGIVALAVYLLVRKPTPADVAWLAGGAAPDAAAAAFYRAYLARQLRFRGAGGLIGVAFAAALAVRYGVGLVLFFNDGPLPLADALFMGVAGVIVGGLAAESYRIGRRADAAEASLEARDRFAPAKVMLAARLTLAASALVAVASAAGGLGAAGCWTVVVCAVPVALGEWTQRAIRDRRRLAGPPEVMAADQAVRGFAGRTAAWLELAIAMLTLGWVLPAWDGLGLLGLGCVVLAVIALIRSSVRAPRAFRRTFAAAPAGLAPAVGGPSAAGGPAAGGPAALNTAPDQKTSP